MRIVTLMLPPKLSCKMIVIFLPFLSCSKPYQQGSPIVSQPKSVIAKGYLVPADSMTEPKVVIAGVPEEIPVKKRVVPLTFHKKQRAGIPKIVSVNNPKKNTPGQDSFSLPKLVPATSKPFIPGIPEIVQVKDPFIGDQNPESFASFSKLQGLKHHVITAVTQDKSGNMWFGTGGGVSCYDGKTFTHFTNKEGLCENTVPSILEDSKGNLWFCSYGGVTKYDGKYFTNYTDKEGLSSNAVCCAVEDKEGNFWFGTEEGGVNKFDGKTFTHYTEKEGLSNNIVTSATMARNGDLWFGTEGGACKFDGKSFTRYGMDEGLSNDVVYSIKEDRNGAIWIATFGGGVNKFDGQTFTQYTEKEGIGDNHIFHILEDSKGDLWFSTYGNGITRFDGKTFIHYTEKEGLSNNSVTTAFEDRSGNLWFGTNSSGVNLYHGRVFTHLTVKEGLKNNYIFSITEDRQGTLWFGTATGELFNYSARLNDSVGQGASFTYIDGIEKQTQMLFPGICDKKGNLWFGTYNSGLIKYDGKTFTRYSKKQGLSDDQVLYIAEDNQGNLWLGTLAGGVNKFDGKTFTHYTTKQGLLTNEIRTININKSGSIWFAGYKGVSLFDGKKIIHFTGKEGFTNEAVFSILEDKKGNTWFGTNTDGLIKYDGHTFTKYTEKDGLISSSIVSILEDKKQNLWFGSRFGLSMLSAEKQKNTSDKLPHLFPFKNYTYEDGFFGIGCNVNCICETRDNSIWICTNDRLTIYHPEGNVKDTVAPKMQLTSVALYYENIPWQQFVSRDTSVVLGNGVVIRDFKFDSTSRWYNLPENLSLAYNNNYLTFNFIGISQKQPDKVKYQYKLEGLDKNWSAVSKRRDVTYSNLDPGVYTFKVKAVNGEGYWSSDFSYKFTIRPPFWQTWWFRALLVLMGLALMFGYVRLRTRQLRLQERKLARLVEQRTRELEQSNRDKDRIMQMVVHDLRNPLSGIHRLSSMMLDYKDHLAKHKEMLELINDSSMSLFEMIDDLIEATLKNHKETVKLKETDMEVLVTQSASALEFKAREKKQEIILIAEDKLFAFVDPQKILRVLSNLISNAIKFSPNESRIVIQLNKKDNSLQISIEDHGIGIPDEIKDRVFDMFTKAKRHGTAGEEPFGLGLSICKQIVDAHGGKIWFESQSGKGTTFYFELPLLQD
jgi:ligand-binding sensor domain-containing protein/signal transduction histidine kinase